MRSVQVELGHDFPNVFAVPSGIIQSDTRQNKAQIILHISPPKILQRSDLININQMSFWWWNENRFYKEMLLMDRHCKQADCFHLFELSSDRKQPNQIFYCGKYFSFIGPASFLGHHDDITHTLQHRGRNKLTSFHTSCCLKTKYSMVTFKQSIYVYKYIYY